MTDSTPASTLLWRALRLRCPNCGAGRLFSRWVSMRHTCPNCSLLFDRGEPDYFIGSYTVNFIAAELAIVFAGFLVVLATWPDVPWDPLRWGLLSMMVPFPILTYPFAKTVWLAIDLAFRPIRFSDLAGHGENLPEREAEQT